MGRTPEHQAVIDYIDSLGRRDGTTKLKQRAAEYLYEKGQSDLFQDGGGIIGHLIRVDNPGWSDVQVNGAMGGLGLDERYVPAEIILRDVLPLMVKLRQLLLPLTSGNIARREELVRRLGLLARQYETPDETALVGLQTLQEMAKEWAVDLPR